MKDPQDLRKCDLFQCQDDQENPWGQDTYRCLQVRGVWGTEARQGFGTSREIWGVQNAEMSYATPWFRSGDLSHQSRSELSSLHNSGG
jgi:hypothetical protein